MKTSKKLKSGLLILLAMLMIGSLAACGNNAGTSSGGTEPESSADDVSTDRGTQDSSTVPDNPQTESGSETKDDSADTVKVLVAYFSATNTTEGVAQTIADSLGADLYEITPEQPYSAADLNYNNDKSRSTIEMNDPSSRPAISGSVDNMDQYDILFIGYPIWWGEAPRILSTFVESYNFSGKTVVPFCTSGSSGVGSSAANLEGLTSGATWIPGSRFNGGASRSSVAEWINGLGLDITAQ